ncbi:MAG: hypothetical protein A3A80_01800 [Candidatus Terrybacteria bacterium RIFCSPLOWO2_01_FULL_44_24]|uniref:Uncharacterized protein n=1 Tax=Candidatus Terrybacteria bacterium RIFCSPHIGHO2_01_FULL_43_35 TaxID=1802361 RepID=A0A1G2PG27_9BACT|nr:MAG: hypothetical protein A2828_01590 [Candidatus Terrybacteria bacterium RIFCSPHIGHO2_01_FULL_43_35]OHA50818.1 MAG: hypothetical protein A3A80_01800 [Candidatus Terrybacteria bacterium RIFCSPLOWO2_01_FULL_44_24]
MKEVAEGIIFALVIGLFLGALVFAITMLILSFVGILSAMGALQLILVFLASWLICSVLVFGAMLLGLFGFGR